MYVFIYLYLCIYLLYAFVYLFIVLSLNSWHSELELYLVYVYLYCIIMASRFVLSTFGDLNEFLLWMDIAIVIVEKYKQADVGKLTIYERIESQYRRRSETEDYSGRGQVWILFLKPGLSRGAGPDCMCNKRMHKMHTDCPPPPLFVAGLPPYPTTYHASYYLPPSYLYLNLITDFIPFFSAN